MNTKKIADAIGAKIKATMVDIAANPNLVSLDDFDLVGFGSGIATGERYPNMLKFVEKLPNVQNKKAFIFSTSGTYKEKKMQKDHKALRDILQKKGFEIVNEFSCKGFYYLGFKFFGFNKKHPNNEDIKNAELFAEKL